ncbi:ATP-binding protein [Streptomyces sp. NPDC058409]|uniref:ATP-binding protein n=1 Tax=Streptomyces sp. NPDC058409 TaxID=3346484 RepID=UPI003649309D
MSITMHRRPAVAATCPSVQQLETARGITLDRKPEMTGRARRFLRLTATDWSLEEAAADTAELVVSELFTNSVQHTTADRIRLRLRRHYALLYIEVLDQHPCRHLTAARPAPDAENGRGLLLVEAFCLRWGRRADRDGSLTWACLSVTEEAPPRHERATGPEQPLWAGSLPRPVAPIYAHPLPVSR